MLIPQKIHEQRNIRTLKRAETLLPCRFSFGPRTGKHFIFFRHPKIGCSGLNLDAAAATGRQRSARFSAVPHMLWEDSSETSNAPVQKIHCSISSSTAFRASVALPSDLSGSTPSSFFSENGAGPLTPRF
jgi:hypothetical protein